VIPSIEQLPEWLRSSGTMLAVLTLILGALAHVFLRGWSRRRVRRDEAAAIDAPSDAARVRWWLSRSFRDSVAPLALLIWIHAFYVALTRVLSQMPGSAGVTSGIAFEALDWAYGLGLMGAFFWLLSRAGDIIDALLISMSRQAATAWDGVMLPLAGKAARRLLPLLALGVGAATLPASPELEQFVRQGAVVLVIGVVAWMLFQGVGAVATLVLRRHRLDVRDNLEARAIHTQIVVLQKVANTAIAIFAAASILMVFDSARQFGASILASAGIAGIVVGFAAQRSISTLLAGFQIALTQPIRIDDVVIVENEWGRVEDITLTYVVVQIWDQRRLVVPISYFIERPFQNWTRTSADILGSVFLHVDYTVPIDELRGELTRILKASPYWDGRVNALNVTDAKEHSLEIRALASAADASLAWSLRCEVREKLVDFLQRHYPDGLPRVRAWVSPMQPESAWGTAAAAVESRL
jgi:small-conductance mechanosensitive channel